MQGLENTGGGLTDYGSFIALGLVVVWAALLIPLCRSKLKTTPFLAASGSLAFLIVFFWLWPTITEISLGKFGSIKTNVEQAKTYLNQMKGIQSQVKDIREKIEQDAQAASQLQAEAAKMRTDFDKAQAERQPRHITPEQAAKIINRLTPVQKGAVSVAPAFIDSTDAKDFAAQISEVLTKAGFNLVKAPKDVLSYSVPGVFLIVRDIQHAPSYAAEIQNAFKDEAGILLSGVSQPESVSDDAPVVIAVSSHP
jgi:F0F1-type ATP synthase membrane subunit b/b'